MITPNPMLEVAHETAPVEKEVSASAQSARRDRELVSRFLGGDEKAFNEIVFHYREKLTHLALGFLHDRHEAEEIVQDVFIRAHRKLAQFRGDSSLATWLHCITVNLSRNRYWYFFRRRKDQSCSLDQKLGNESEATFSDLMASDAMGPDQQIAIVEFEHLVEKCFRRISREHREILGLKIEQHMSYDEISEAFGITVGTVKSRIARAREKLLAHMAAECPELASRSDVLKMINGDNLRVGLVRA